MKSYILIRRSAIFKSYKNTHRLTMFSLLLGVVCFILLFILFYFKSFNLYTTNFDIDDMGKGQKKTTKYLEFGGRYYCSKQAAKEQKIKLVEHSINKKLITYLAANPRDVFGAIKESKQ